MKKISEMTPDEALTEQALAVFKRRLEQARKKAVESAAARARYTQTKKSASSVASALRLSRRTRRAKMKKCKECEYAKAYNVPRNGNGASWRSGHFSQKGYVCSHKDGESKLPIIFYGETAPRKCPLRNGGQK